MQKFITEDIISNSQTVKFLGEEAKKMIEKIEQQNI